ncbi:hypothetical protein LEP1GSC123_0810 [Leptospira borgpetersenii str. 200701203]|uniref:Uncharacterized protein n=1 Tax=Leptospira borgpetersenii str. 200701203 TaxID=1193007 RepID=M3HVW8_LEPBO|nr:hypothetical protein LEP1GSC123_0810 [Leptospira borgpetersenii str. 200701203]
MFDFDYFEKAQAKREKKKESQNLQKTWYTTCIYLCKNTGTEVIR